MTTTKDERIAELERANAALQARLDVTPARDGRDFDEQAGHQAAVLDVLKAMSASPGDPQPVFDQIVTRAQALCHGRVVALHEYDGTLVHFRAVRTPLAATVAELAKVSPVAAGYVAMWPMAPTRETITCQAILDARTIHVRDRHAEAGLHVNVRAQTARSQVSIPLQRAGAVIGAITLSADEPGGFSDTQLALLQTFAEQAVIAITSAETYRALAARTAELAARNGDFAAQVAHQAATIDVLKVMSSISGDTKPVFDIILARALELCGAEFGGMVETDGTTVEFRAMAGWNQEQADNYARHFPRPLGNSIMDRSMRSGQPSVVADIYAESGALLQAVRDLGFRSQLTVPLMRDGKAIGCFAIGSRKIGGFNDSHVALLQPFAEQAVIAIGSAANFRALQDRTAELTRSVGELQALEETMRAVNASLDRETVLATIIARAVALGDAAEGTIYEYDAGEDVFLPRASAGMEAARVAALRDRRLRMGQTHLGRSAAMRAPVAVADVQTDPTVPEAATLLAGIHAVLAVPLLRDDGVVGGMVIRRRSEGEFTPSTVTLMQTFAAQAVLAIENARLFNEVQARTHELAQSLDDLHRTQDRLIQTEKLASLGALTAGIAHEIKNPLNFVNNFAALSVELLDELREVIAPEPIGAAARDEVEELTEMVKGNLEKVVSHGKRADGIVRNMLLHSRESGGERREVDFNAIVEEALNLAFHGARAEKPGFNIALTRHFDPAAGSVALHPQEFTRVLLNLISNGFYAAAKRLAEAPAGFEPTLTVSTEAGADAVVVRVRDNGGGMTEAVKARLFEPFFTTKPAGEGTGLGLSLSHDIVVKQHGGSITVTSEPEVFTEFAVTLPRGAA